MLTARRDPGSGQHRLAGASDGFTGVANDFLDALVARGLSPLTIKSSAFALVPFHHWFARQEKSLEQLEQTDLVPYIAKLRADGAQPLGILEGKCGGTLAGGFVSRPQLRRHDPRSSAAGLREEAVCQGAVRSRAQNGTSACEAAATEYPRRLRAGSSGRGPSDGHPRVGRPNHSPNIRRCRSRAGHRCEHHQRRPRPPCR